MKNSKRQFTFSLRLTLLVIAVLAVLLGLDRFVESKAKHLKQKLDAKPTYASLTIQHTSVQDRTTIFNRLCFKRRIVVTYTGLVDKGHTIGTWQQKFQVTPFTGTGIHTNIASH